MHADIGPYELLDVLGRGGMGVVYRARHRETGLEVALKTVAVAGARLVQGLRREIQALARLRHPGIVPIVAEGLHEGIPWYAMELIAGPSLRQAASAPGGLPLAASLGLVRRLCSALGFLHGEGFVHRDLKPENILVKEEKGTRNDLVGAGLALPLEGEASLAPTSSGSRPVLMDFGLAARFGSREALEAAGGMAGTYAYMAPEQASGEQVDARADLYALGCILYELLTGRPPFVGETPFHLLHQHARVEPAPPSSLADAVPPALDALVLRLLAKEPARRLGYASDVGRWLAELGAEGPAAGQEPPSRTYLYRPRFTGRAPLLEELRVRLEQVCAGQGAMVLLGGHSGSGKTRLATELTAVARRAGIRVLTGEAQPVGGGALHLWQRPLQAVADRCREGALDLGARGRILAQYEPSLAALPGQVEAQDVAPLPPREAQLRLFVALAEAFSALGAGKPVLLVLDDLQWADELSLQFLVFLLKTRALERLPWLVLGTYRAEEREELLQKLSESALVQRRELDRFGQEAIGSMVSDMLALDAAPELFVRFLERHSEGNPFFVAEYLHTAVAEGVLSRDEQGHWRVLQRERRHLTEAAYDALPLPGSVRELVGRRLGLLEKPALELVQVGAVLGRQWDPGLLAEVSGASEAAIGERLGGLFRRQVLEEVGTHGGARALRFVHEKIREVAYEGIAEERREDLHRRAAGSIEARAGSEEALAAASAELAHHWLGAGETRRALPHLKTAASQAERRAASKEALALYQRALEVAAALAAEDAAAREEELDLLQRCLDVFMFLSRFDEAMEMARRMERRAHEQGSDVQAARALRNQAVVRITQGRPQEGLPLIQTAIEELQRLGDRHLLAGAYGNRLTAYYLLGRMEESLQDGERALGLLEEPRDRTQIGNTLQIMACVHYELGQRQESRRLMEQALGISQRSQDMKAMLCETNLGCMEMLEGHFASAEPRLRRAAEQARKSEAWFAALSAMHNLGFFEAELGRLDAAVRCQSEALRLAKEIGDEEVALRSCDALGRAYLKCGRFDAAENAFREGLSLGVGSTWSNALVSGLALCDAAAGRVSDSVARFEQAEAQLHSAERSNLLAILRLDRAEASLLLARHDEAVSDCSDVAELARSLKRPDLLFRSLALGSRALLRQGKTREAQLQAGQAADVVREMEFSDEQRASFSERPDVAAWSAELGDAACAS